MRNRSVSPNTTLHGRSGKKKRISGDEIHTKQDPQNTFGLLTLFSMFNSLKKIKTHVVFMPMSIDPETSDQKSVLIQHGEQNPEKETLAIISTPAYCHAVR